MSTIFVFSLLFARREPFLVDEYLSLRTALAGTPTDVWHVLKTAPLAVDPPLYHFLTVYSLRVFGRNEFAARFPATVAYLAMSFLLYRFARRHIDLFTALIVVVLCMQCGAFEFSYQARPYTLVLAAATLALVSWTSLISGINRRTKKALSILGLFLGMGTAIGSHWFGFLVLIPVGIAEVFRTVQQRKFDVAIWSGLIAAATTAFAYLPLLPAAAKYKALPWKGVAVADVSDTFRLILEPCVFPLALLLISLAIARYYLGPLPHPPKTNSISAPVFVCIVAFALIPFAGLILGVLVTHAFQPRYALSCMIGILILTGLIIRDGVRRYVPLLALGFMIIGAYALFSHYREFSSLRSDSDEAMFANQTVLGTNPDLPVVPGDDEMFLRIEAHGPLSVRQRCMFPIDPISIRLLRQNTNFLMTEALRKWTNLPIADLSAFLTRHSEFYLLERAGGQGWLLQWALQQGAQVDLRGSYAGNLVYIVRVRR